LHEVTFRVRQNAALKTHKGEECAGDSSFGQKSLKISKMLKVMAAAATK
jgi:hypothetical protein